MRLAISLVTASFLFAESSPPVVHLKKLPELGQRLTVPRASLKVNQQCASGPSQFYPCFSAEFSGLEYTVFWTYEDSGKEPVIRHIRTVDKNFVAPSGHRIGDVVQLERDQLLPVAGFHVYGGKAFGGWRMVVGFNGELSTVNETPSTVWVRILSFVTEK